jgi:hypothetical protein
MAKKPEAISVDIQPIKMRSVVAFLCGTSPLIMHRFAFKAWQELLYPSPKKNAAERASTLKHQPLEEYRGCFYRNRDPAQAYSTRYAAPPPPQRGAGRRVPTWSADQRRRSNINLYGVPQIMAMVRSSDMNSLTPTSAADLPALGAASRSTTRPIRSPTTRCSACRRHGMHRGLGDWRPQRAGLTANFRLCAAGIGILRSPEGGAHGDRA